MRPLRLAPRARVPRRLRHPDGRSLLHELARAGVRPGADLNAPAERGARAALTRRRSLSKVTDEAPGREELLQLVAAASRVADHSALTPWRLLEIRGEARDRVGRALAEAGGDEPERMIAKARRAPLLIAVIVSRRPNGKVPGWEQEAVAAGVAHALSLLLDEAGWGVMWRTGSQTRSDAVRRAHLLREGEDLLGWLYVGGRPEGASREPKSPPADPGSLLTPL